MTNPLHELILFIHVPKTAGTSFRVAAEQKFKGRILKDYWPDKAASSPEIAEHVYERPDRQALARLITERNVAMICGHVSYETYADLVPPERVVVFLREPVQRVLSEFHHFRRVYGFKGTLTEYVRLPLQRNRQCRMTNGLDLARCALVGLSEYYGESLRLLAKRTNLQLSYLELNRNPEKNGVPLYELTDDEASQIEKLNADDVSLYDRAAQMFALSTGVKLPAIASDTMLAPPEQVADGRGLIGSLDGFSNGHLHGWAMRRGLGRPVQLDVFVGDRLVRTIVADRYRSDLERAGVHATGCAGFAIQLGNLAPGTTIRCCLHGTDEQLRNSPLMVSAPKAASK